MAFRISQNDAPHKIVLTADFDLDLSDMSLRIEVSWVVFSVLTPTLEKPRLNSIGEEQFHFSETEVTCHFNSSQFDESLDGEV